MLREIYYVHSKVLKCKMCICAICAYVRSKACFLAVKDCILSLRCCSQFCFSMTLEKLVSVFVWLKKLFSSRITRLAIADNETSRRTNANFESCNIGVCTCEDG